MSRRGESPEQTAAACDVTFAMLADPAGAVSFYTFCLPNLHGSSCLLYVSCSPSMHFSPLVIVDRAGKTLVHAL